MTTTNKELTYDVSDQSLGYSLPQRMGRRLWAPMLAMALMAWPVGLILSWIRAAEIASATPDPDTIATLGQLVPAFMFIGFMAVFAAVSFAIARILGVFRAGGGDTQAAARRSVHTLRMPVTAKVFLGTMMMAMMTIAVAVVLHFVAAAGVSSWSETSLEQ